MKDKEYHVANFATFVSKTLIFSPWKMDEFNFKSAQYCINKIFELTESCIWAILKWMLKSGNWTSWRSILIWNHTCDFKSNLRCALAWFWNNAYDFSPNCTPLSSITIINDLDTIYLCVFRCSSFKSVFKKCNRSLSKQIYKCLPHHSNTYHYWFIGTQMYESSKNRA